jgi:hypothetical protein
MFEIIKYFLDWLAANGLAQEGLRIVGGIVLVLVLEGKLSQFGKFLKSLLDKKE